MSLTTTIPGHGTITITKQALKGIAACGGELHCAVEAAGCREHGVTFSPGKKKKAPKVSISKGKHEVTLSFATTLVEALDGAILDFEKDGKKTRFMWRELNVPKNRRCSCGRSFGKPLGKRGECMKKSGADCAACPMKILRKL